MPLISDTLKPEFEIGDIFEHRLKTAHYSLFAYSAVDCFSFALLENETNRFAGFRHYDFSHSKSINETLNLLGKIIADEPLLKSTDYKRSILAVESRKNMIIPQSHFDIKHIQNYFALTFELQGNEDLFHEELHYTDAVNLYCMDSSLTYFIRHNFPNTVVRHYITAWLNSLLLKYKLRKETFMCVNILNKTINICVINNGKLIFYNTFQYFQEDDIMYYIMNVIEQLKLDTYSTKVEVSQGSNKQVDIRNMLNKYLRDIKFTDRTANHLFSYHFNSVPDHYFPVIFDLDLCV